MNKWVELQTICRDQANIDNVETRFVLYLRLNINI